MKKTDKLQKEETTPKVDGKKKSGKPETTANETKQLSSRSATKEIATIYNVAILRDVKKYICDEKFAKQLKKRTGLDEFVIKQLVSFAKDITNNFTYSFTETSDPDKQKATPTFKVIIYGSHEFYYNVDNVGEKDAPKYIVRESVNVDDVFKCFDSALRIWDIRRIEAKKAIALKSMSLEKYELQLKSKLGAAFDLLTPELKKQMLKTMQEEATKQIEENTENESK